MKKRIPKKKNQVVFENERYKITHIPLNYLIQVKITKQNDKGKITKILPDFYSPDDRTLDYAKETAEYMINKTLNSPAVSSN